MKTFFLSALLGLLVLSAFAQRSENAPDHAGYLSCQFNGLYSTHDDFFPGVSLSWNQAISRHIQVGLGAEYSGAHYHPDNDWDLYDLRFLPLFLDLQWKSGALKDPWTLYFRLSHGVTFFSYTRQKDPTDPRIRIREHGLYVSGGAGIAYRISPYLQLNAEFGLKAFNISMYDLDLNPHGLSARAGILFGSHR